MLLLHYIIYCNKIQNFKNFKEDLITNVNFYNSKLHEIDWLSEIFSIVLNYNYQTSLQLIKLL